MNEPAFPTPWQKKTLWAAITTVSVVGIGWIAVKLIALTFQVIGFLQPILIPFAVAGVMAYLLDPVVARIASWGTSRQRAVWAVFAIMLVVIGGVVVWIVPALSDQTVNLAKKVPGYTMAAKRLVVDFAEDMRVKYGVRLLPMTQPIGDALPGAAVGASLPPPPKKTPATVIEASAAPASSATAAADPTYDVEQFLSGDWVKTTLPTLLRNTWNVIRTSVGGFLGVFGFLLSMIIVPVYLYYFLVESSHISESWGEYVPLRASEFKDEVVAALNEINGYLIAFFRGQLVVSLINGVATGTLLVFVGLDFGLLIGLALCLLGFIPYLGIAMCWIPAVIIASVQGGSWLIPAGADWYVFPIIVTGIFTLVQQVDGLFVTPKIVGESVGLHPMTVIVSVFVWGLLLGGLLGAILAVPLTATVKVLLRRYIWQRRLKADAAVMTEETFAEQQARSPEKGAAALAGQ